MIHFLFVIRLHSWYVVLQQQWQQSIHQEHHRPTNSTRIYRCYLGWVIVIADPFTKFKKIDQKVAIRADSDES